MMVVCKNCSARVQLEDQLAPEAELNCPNCYRKLDVTPGTPAVEKSALAIGNSPSTAPRRGETNPAPLFQVESQSVKPVRSDAERFMQLLSEFLNKGILEPGGNDDDEISRVRKVLVCTPEEHRDRIARTLTAQNFKVYVAADTKQAVERMREFQMDVVLLEPQFDSAEQGAAFVVREVNVMRPAQRRRLFFVLLSPTLRSLDAHGAFLNNVNAIVNLKDVDELPKLLDQSLRSFNELYKDFNAAVGVQAI